MVTKVKVSLDTLASLNARNILGFNNIVNFYTLRDIDKIDKIIIINHSSVVVSNMIFELIGDMTETDFKSFVNPNNPSIAQAYKMESFEVLPSALDIQNLTAELTFHKGV